MCKTQARTLRSSGQTPAGLRCTGWRANAGTARAPSAGTTCPMCWGSALERAHTWIQENLCTSTSASGHIWMLQGTATKCSQRKSGMGLDTQASRAVWGGKGSNPDWSLNSSPSSPYLLIYFLQGRRSGACIRGIWFETSSSQEYVFLPNIWAAFTAHVSREACLQGMCTHSWQRVCFQMRTWFTIPSGQYGNRS